MSRGRRHQAREVARPDRQSVRPTPSQRDRLALGAQDLPRPTDPTTHRLTLSTQRLASTTTRLYRSGSWSNRPNAPAPHPLPAAPTIPPGAQDRAGPFIPAAPSHAGERTAGSPCSRPDPILPGGQIAAGYALKKKENTNTRATGTKPNRNRASGRESGPRSPTPPKATPKTPLSIGALKVRNAARVKLNQKYNAVGTMKARDCSIPAQGWGTARTSLSAGEENGCAVQGVAPYCIRLSIGLLVRRLATASKIKIGSEPSWAERAAADVDDWGFDDIVWDW